MLESCPKCNENIQEAKLTTTDVAGLTLSVEVVGWFFAGLLVVLFSIEGIPLAYILGMLVSCVLFILGYYHLSLVSCEKCGANYSRNELAKKYNKRL